MSEFEKRFPKPKDGAVLDSLIAAHERALRCEGWLALANLILELGCDDKDIEVILQREIAELKKEKK